MELENFRDLIEIKSRSSRSQAGRIAEAQIAQKVRFDVGAGKELLVDAGIVEAGHGPAIEPERHALRG